MKRRRTALAVVILWVTGAGVFRADAQFAGRVASGSQELLHGTVVDDQSGQPIVDFVAQPATVIPNSTEDIFWNHFSMGTAQQPGRFTARRPTSNELVRILAAGYVPQILTEQMVSNAPASGLEVRLKRGKTFLGVVTDDAGHPVARARLLVTTVQRAFFMDGKSEYGDFKGGSTTTDDAGRFMLSSEGTGPQKVLVLSADGRLVWPAVQSDPEAEMKIILPKTGSLVVRYDIPGDAAEAKPELRLITTNKERPLWANVSFGFSTTVTNGGQIVLTNLTPGLYRYRRWKSVSHDFGADIDAQTVAVEAGKTAALDLVGTNGQRVRGMVTGPEKALAAGGIILVRSAECTGQPWPQRSKNEQDDFKYPTFDVVKFGAEGAFETAMLKPGSYTFIADVFPPGGRAGGFPYHPDYVGIAKITVADQPLAPVTLTLAPALYVNIDGNGFDEQTGMGIPDLATQHGRVDPDKPGGIDWSEGMSGMMAGGGFGPGTFSIWNQKTGDVLRFIANGYLPQTFTREEIIASRQTANLQVRMKRGGELHGTVRDHAGRPEAGAMVYLAPLEQGCVHFGWVMSSGTVTNWAHAHAMTDAAGNFSMRGVGEKPRLIVVTADRQMAQPVEVSGPGQDVKITLPEPATLVVDYDIPGDREVANAELNFHTDGLKQPLWSYITNRLDVAMTNGGRTVLSNLTPGTYDFSRLWMGGPGTNVTFAYVFGEPPTFVHGDEHEVVLESGRTKEIRLTRTGGQRVQVQVSGLEPITNSTGPYLFVSSGGTDFKGKMDTCVVAMQLTGNGLVQTASLEPGNYQLLAAVYEWGKAPERKYADDEPRYSEFIMNPLEPVLVASTNVTVLAEGPPPSPVKLEFRRWDEAGKRR